MCLAPQDEVLEKRAYGRPGILEKTMSNKHDVTIVISVKDLTRCFGELVAVDGLTLDVQAGEVFGFLGHNGAGKTTAVRLLNGVLEPSSGTTRVLGFDPLTEGPQLRRRTGVLTETPSLDERLTAYENLRIYADLYDVAPDQVNARIGELLDRFELSDRAHEKVGGYSKGMKQRLALARALIHRPELIFLDEPTSGLDPVAAKQVRELIKELSQREGRTVFMCTHNLVEAQRLCHRVAVLEHGRILALGTPAELGQKVGRRQQIEIEVSSDTAHTAVTTLHAIKGLTDIQRDNALVKFSGAGRERIPEVIGALVRAGVRIYSVMPDEPTLEEIYFALHEDAEEVSA
jgi:ABC-2 type transport system ATP-binding protein